MSGKRLRGLEMPGVPTRMNPLVARSRSSVGSTSSYRPKDPSQLRRDDQESIPIVSGEPSRTSYVCTSRGFRSVRLEM